MTRSPSPPVLALAIALLALRALPAQEPSAPTPTTESSAGETTASPSPAAEASADSAAGEPEPDTAAGATQAEPTAGAAGTPGEAAADAEPTEPPKEPQLVPGETVFDAGRVHKGERVSLEFQLENRGEADLLIRSVQPSCGCTVTSFDRKIEPGKSGKVRAWLDTSNLVGEVVKYLTVSTNDAATPRLQLSIKANVLAFVTATPSYARLLQVQTMPPTSTSLMLWSDGDPPLQVLGVDAPAPWLEVAARPATEDELRPEGPKEQWRLDVSIHNDAPLGALDQVIVVRTNHPRQKRLEIPLSGFVRPVVQAVPDVADFGKLGRVNERRRFAIKVYNFGADPVTIDSVACDLPFATVALHPEQEGRRYRIEIEISDGAPKGKFEGKLSITTSSRVVPALTVAVRGRIE